MNTALLRLLNIKPSEGWLVWNLFMVQLFQSIGIAILLPMANALFLVQFNVEELPKVYILSAVVLLIVNHIYSRLEHRMSIQRLILVILLLSAGSVLLIRLLIYGVEYTYAPVVLLIWYQVIYLLCGNAFWALASMIFDVRESKRTFSILSAGDTPAKLLGYLSISSFAQFINIKDFLFISVLCFIISFLFMRNIIRSKRVDFEALAHKASHKETLKALGTPGMMEMVKSFFGNKLIILISALSFIVVASLTVIDFTFLSEVKLKYHDDVTLLAFLGSFFAIGRLFAIVAKITLTSRIESRLGIKKTLLILPLLLIAFTVFILLSRQLEGDLNAYLYIFGSMVLMTEVLKSVLQDPLVMVLFQPLKPTLRLKGHLTAKGIMAPLGLFFAGLFIYISVQTSGALHIPKTCMLLLGLCSIWILIIFMVDRQYLVSLIESLKTGFFRGNILLTNEEAIKAVLLKKIGSNNSAEVIYAADTLEKLDLAAFQLAIPELLSHENPDLIKFGLKKVREYKLMHPADKIRELMNSNIPDELKIECIMTLSALHENHTDALIGYLDNSHPAIQKEAMITLFTSGDVHAIISAGQRLMAWISSPEENERMCAAEVIGSVADKNFYTSLERLINDPSSQVSKKAVEAASHVKNSKLVPLLLKKINEPHLSRQVVLALSAYGDDVLSHFPAPKEFAEMNRKTALLYVNIASNVRGDKAFKFLEDLLIAEASMRHDIIYAMKEANYKCNDDRKETIMELIGSETEKASSMLQYRMILEKSPKTEILQNALITELKTVEENIFYLFSFVYERQKFLRAYDNLKSGTKEHIANAIEIVDIGVPKKVCDRLVPVIEYLHLNELPLSPRAAGNDEVLTLMKNIISGINHTFNSWTRATALYSMNFTQPREAVAFLKTSHVHGDFLLEETRDYVLAKQL